MTVTFYSFDLYLNNGIFVKITDFSVINNSCLTSHQRLMRC